jgi:ribonuclease-3
LGALYLDQGLEVTTEFFLPFLRSHLEASSAEALPRDAKTRLQEWAQAAHHEAPTYVTVQAAGPDHAKQFTVDVLIMGQVRGQGVGHSKQAAEQAAAQVALDTVSAQVDRAARDVE